MGAKLSILDELGNNLTKKPAIQRKKLGTRTSRPLTENADGTSAHPVSENSRKNLIIIFHHLCRILVRGFLCLDNQRQQRNPDRQGHGNRK